MVSEPEDLRVRPAGRAVADPDDESPGPASGTGSVLDPEVARRVERATFTRSPPLRDRGWRALFGRSGVAQTRRLLGDVRIRARSASTRRARRRRRRCRRRRSRRHRPSATPSGNRRNESIVSRMTACFRRCRAGSRPPRRATSRSTARARASRRRTAPRPRRYRPAPGRTAGWRRTGPTPSGRGGSRRRKESGQVYPRRFPSLIASTTRSNAGSPRNI